ncbi:MAG TPA: flavin reductase family protein [Gemmatimonadaceae bacterium]|nr:flavin reductase family protein [Gemmatimonadaceae bacterium]
MTVDPATFRAAMATVPTAVTVISVRDRSGADHGMTVGAFTSLSLQPPLVLACIGDDATIAAVMRDAAMFGVSVLAEDQGPLSSRFADRERRGFADVPHTRGPAGTALLDGAVAHLECAVVARHPGGDHTIVVGEVRHAVHTSRAPLLHHRSAYRRIGP